KFLTQDERYLIVEWIDIGGQWDNIQGPDLYPGILVR
ncbi:MAG: hydrazine synthase subunit, partial [Planctomycetota bacterium]|nr:hydrazine synthase subunit [Planctomycetota bacterium]MDQ1272597.1 hydrazine synthase subunit [Planctomycetota bacterium]